MSGMLGFISYGLGTIVGFVVIATLLVWFIQDITQKKHSVLRNYPVVGRLRYYMEELGEYLRQYFFMNDREELPFNRATRGWVLALWCVSRPETRAPKLLGLLRRRTCPGKQKMSSFTV